MSTAVNTAATEDRPGRRLRDWVPEAGLAASVLVIGLAEVSRSDSTTDRFPVVVGIAVAVLLARHAPAFALGLVWTIGVLQVVLGLPLLTVEVVVAVVAFGCARWGRPTTVVVSGLSIPAAAGVAALLLLNGGFGFFRGIAVLHDVVDYSYRSTDSLALRAAVLGMSVLAVPWLAGLVVRASVRARSSRVRQEAAEEDAAAAQREAGQAQEIARLRDEQTRLARDVHDVVGHSLAVILAQAESAQYLEDDPVRLKSMLSTIATSARSSLTDVRQVLGSTRAAEPRADGLQQLVDGVRATGREVEVVEVGTPRPLPPELEVVAHRVLQEMLTNAVKHGRRDAPVLLERHWPAGGFERDLRLEVRNAAAERPGPEETQPLTPVSPEGAGQGLPGMARRLDSIGGRLDVRRRQDEFTTTAWVPVSRS